MFLISSLYAKNSFEKIQRLKQNQLSDVDVEEELENCKFWTDDVAAVQQIGGFVCKSTLDRCRQSNHSFGKKKLSYV